MKQALNPNPLAHRFADGDSDRPAGPLAASAMDRGAEPPHDRNSVLTSDLIARVRAHQEAHPDLKKSHHFVFDCPLDPSHDGPTEYVWLGLNPGGDDEDWARHGINTEETREYDFQVEHGRSRGSTHRLRKLRAFLGDDVFRRTTHSQLFFWCSDGINQAFRDRYGYTFQDHPHWDFCCEINRALIDRIQPKAVFAESRPTLRFYEGRFGLLPGPTHRNAAGQVLIVERRLESGAPFYCFDHLSARRNHAEVRAKLSDLLCGPR